MALVLSCPRCSQSRTLASDERRGPHYCPFCHLELDLPALPVLAPVATTRAGRGRRIASLVLFTAMVAVIIAIVAHRMWRAYSVSATKSPSSLTVAVIPSSSAIPANRNVIVAGEVAHRPKTIVSDAVLAAIVDKPPSAEPELIPMPAEIDETAVTTADTPRLIPKTTPDWYRRLNPSQRQPCESPPTVVLISSQP